MKIRQEQMSAFSEYMRTGFEVRLIARLRQLFRQELQEIPGNVLQSRVHGAMERAKGYGIEIEEDVAGFVDLTVELGERFDTDPAFHWASDILNDPEVNGHVKVQLIEKHLGEFGSPQPAFRLAVLRTRMAELAGERKDRIAFGAAAKGGVR